MKKEMKKNKLYYIYSKLNYLAKNSYLNKIIKKKYTNFISTDNFKVWKDIKKKIIVINIHTLKLNRDN